MDLATLTCFVHGIKVNKVYAEAGQLFTLTLASGKPATMFKEGRAKVIEASWKKTAMDFLCFYPLKIHILKLGTGQ